MFWFGKKTSSKIHFRIHRMGWIFLAITVIIGLGAGKTQSSLMYLIFGAMMGAAVASGLVARRMIAAVSLRRDVSERVWQNRTVHLGYSLRNHNRIGSCLGLSVEEVSPQGIQSASGYCVHLPARQVFRAGARFVSRRRGRIELREIRVSTLFPFGLMEAHRHLYQESEILVWPALGKLKRQLLNRGAAQATTSAPSLVSGGQDEFFGLREYRQDDNPRWIHWRKSAGRAAPVVREMAHPVPDELWIALDTYCPDASEVFLAGREKLLRFAATLIDHALSRGYQVGMVLASGGRSVVIPVGSGQAQRCQLLDALAGVDLNDKLPLPKALAGLDPRALSKAQLAVLWPAGTEEGFAAVRPLRARCRHLSEFDLKRLDAVFEDDPLFVEKA